MPEEIRAQEEFCKGTLDNIQNLIRFMDLKGGVVLTIASLLSGIVSVFASSIYPKCAPPKCPGVLFQGVLFLYFLNLIYVLWKSIRIFIARPPSVGNYTQAPLMLYPLLILKTFQSDKDYYERAIKLTHEQILADYANQIMECSNIYKTKHEYVNSAIRGLAILLLPWFMFIIVGTLSHILK